MQVVVEAVDGQRPDELRPPVAAAVAAAAAADQPAAQDGGAYGGEHLQAAAKAAFKIFFSLFLSEIYGCFLLCASMTNNELQVYVCMRTLKCSHPAALSLLP